MMPRISPRAIPLNVKTSRPGTTIAAVDNDGTGIDGIGGVTGVIGGDGDGTGIVGGIVLSTSFTFPNYFFFQVAKK
jgi:hypothetical protein